MIHHTVASTFSARRTVTFFIGSTSSAVTELAPSLPGKSYGFGLPVIKD